jgi:hypothetical protein
MGRGLPPDAEFQIAMPYPALLEAIMLYWQFALGGARRENHG